MPIKTEMIVFKVVATITQCIYGSKHHVVPVHIYNFYKLAKKANIVKAKIIKILRLLNSQLQKLSAFWKLP